MLGVCAASTCEELHDPMGREEHYPSKTCYLSSKWVYFLLKPEVLIILICEFHDG